MVRSQPVLAASVLKFIEISREREAHVVDQIRLTWICPLGSYWLVFLSSRACSSTLLFFFRPRNSARARGWDPVAKQEEEEGEEVGYKDDEEEEERISIDTIPRSQPRCTYFHKLFVLKRNPARWASVTANRCCNDHYNFEVVVDDSITDLPMTAIFSLKIIYF